MTTDNVDVHVRMRERAKFKKDARDSADDVDRIGDAGDRAARKLGALSVQSSKTRVNIGPFSTTLRGGALAVGAMAVGVGKLTPGLFGLAEATATVVGGGGAAGGVGLLALVQGSSVAKLGLDGLSEALGGSEEAIRNLSPEARGLFDMLKTEGDALRQAAREGLLPGLTAGGADALRNAQVLRTIVTDTAQMMGGLAREGGGMLGSPEWGRDLARMGATNVGVLDDLGQTAFNFADALRHIAVEAGPLALWLSESAKDGSQVIEDWARDARASGDMARFFREARRDLSLLASIGGHGGRGLINLFGAQDVDGTQTLANLDRMMGRFERWSASPAVGENLGAAVVEELSDALGALATEGAQMLGPAGLKAGELFFEGFMAADPLGKALMGSWLAGKLGLFKAAGGLLNRQLGAGGVVGKATPIPVFVTNPGFGPGGGVPGRGGGPGGPLGRFGRFARVGGWAAAATGAYALGDYLRDDVRDQNRADRGLSGEDIRTRAADTMRGRVPLSGERQPRMRVPVDPQGFPSGPPVRIDLHHSTYLDGEIAERHSRRVLERRQARE